MARLDGKVALVTGAGSGIGRACLERFAAEGARVVGAGRTLSKLEDAVAQVEKSGGEARAVRADVSAEADCRALVDAALDAWDGLDILINNAGVGWVYREDHPGGMDGLAETPVEYWREVIEIDLNSLYYVCKPAIEAMRRSGGGSIVNISSVGGVKGMSDGHAYSAAKGGMVNLTRSLALTYGREGIRTNCVAPGLVETEMVRTYMEERGNPHHSDATRFLVSPLGRAARPEEIANACLFLGSDEASYVNGAVLVVDGGSTA